MIRGGSISSAESKIERLQISPAITLVLEKISKFYSFSLGFFVNGGSRDENTAQNGMTHLIEHMLFKGTSKKSSLDIVKFIEGLGGSFDAYTTKENLIIITKFLSEHLNSVFDLISELLFESKIDEQELKKEKSVILEEIKANNEDPGDYVFDLLFKALFPKHPMGFPIAGSIESVRGINTEHVKSYYHDLLKKEMVIAISGNFNYDEFRTLVEKKFNCFKNSTPKRKRPGKKTQKIIIEKKNEISQVHCVFGIRGIEYPSPQRYRFSILNAAFGGGMSSRLFQGLREKKGLVYNVQSFIDLYSDCGISGFYFNCDKKNLPKVAKQLKLIFKDIHQNGFSKEEIELAKTYLTGNLLLSLESSTNRMLRFGREAIQLKKINSIDNIINRIKNINNQEVNELIQPHLNPKNYTIAAIGPVDKNEIEDIFGIVKL